VPFEAYNHQKPLASSDSLSEILKKQNQFHSKSLGSLGENLGKSKLKTLGIRNVAKWEVEEKPIEVVFNE
jgi:hypothetical protein